MGLMKSEFIQSIIKERKANQLKMMARVFVLFARLFRERRVTVLAQSLAYTTIFTLVPILAAFFAILGIVTKNRVVEAKIRETIATYFFPEYVNVIFDQFEKLTAASTVFGVIGFPTLFLAGVLLYVKVYTSINEIWLSEKSSVWFKNIMSFFMTLFFGPMILVLVFSLPPYLQTIPYFQEVVRLVYVETLFTHLIPVSIIFLGLFVLYLYIPSIAVKYTAVMKGAFIASLLIQGSNYLVGFYVKSFAKLDVIYGSLAMIPIFLLWVFLIWLVVLSGAVLTFIFHYHSETGYLDTKGMYNDQSLLCSSFQVMMYFVNSFQTKGNAPDFDQIQLMLGMNRKRLAHILEVLTQEELVTQFERSSVSRKSTTHYQLGVSPENISPHNLIRLFYDPHDHVVFPTELNKLIKLLDIHPGFFMKDVSLQQLQKNPARYLEQMQRLSKEVESAPSIYSEEEKEE